MDALSSISPVSLDTSILAERVSPTVATSKAFGTYLANAASETIGTIRAGETAMIDGLSGKGSLQDAVSAVLAAESSLQSVMAIRDKAISAYNEILRMPI